MAHLGPDEIGNRLKDAEKLVDKTSKYFHYKTPDKYYSIEGFCIIEATEEVGVLYRGLYKDFENIVWLRPLSVFLEEVDVDSKKVKRFQKVV
ncbi:MAG: DUF1653 domain-containing protein [Candidatus Dojkabacteria bacterium]